MTQISMIDEAPKLDKIAYNNIKGFEVYLTIDNLFCRSADSITVPDVNSPNMSQKYVNIENISSTNADES